MDTSQMVRSLVCSYLQSTLRCWRVWATLGKKAQNPEAPHAEFELAAVAVTIAKDHGVNPYSLVRLGDDRIVGRGFFQGKTCFFKYFSNSSQRREAIYDSLMSGDAFGILVHPYRVAPNFVVMPDAGTNIQEILRETHLGQRTTAPTKESIAALNYCPQFLDQLQSELLGHVPESAASPALNFELNKYLMRVTTGGLQHTRASPFWTALVFLMFIKRGGVSKAKGAFRYLPQLSKALRIGPVHGDLHTANVLMDHFNNFKVIDVDDIGYGFAFLEESFFLLHVANDVAPGSLQLWTKIAIERVGSEAHHERPKAALLSLMLMLISLSPGYSGEPILHSLRRQKSLFCAAKQLETLYND